MYGKIKELKTLLDEGLITEEEFEQKKKEILGLDVAQSNSDRDGEKESESVTACSVREVSEVQSTVREANQKPAKSAKPNTKTKKALLVFGAVAALLVVALGLLFYFSESKGVHAPTAQQIEAKANAIGGGHIELKESPYYEDYYSVYYDGKNVGKVDLSEIGLYIDDSSSSSYDSYFAFVQMADAMMEACDPSLDDETVKDLLVEAVDNESAVRNKVTYKVKLTSDRFILRFSVPEGK